MAHPKRKESIVDLTRYIDAKVRVKFSGGREVVGILRGSDQLVNIVLDEAVEYLRDPRDLSVVTEQTRPLGLIVCRGTQVTFICPEDGMESIENPFLQPEPVI